MIKGVGTDIIEINRIEKAVKKDAFLKKCYTENEIKNFGKSTFAQSAAGAFAAKEAVSKAFGTGFRHFSANDIEILKDEMGKPIVNLSEKASDTAKELGIKKIYISISHCNEYAVAFAVAEGD
ncbi:MAG: holo-ACP synthase [Clostridia bacterium]|jgi:phosphopantetheine--protein transferase-like protein|nr:holo-ACP synthase [Clostridia bacterium]MCI2013793.1 holo-ACP synthase [Clostridia bacterium]